MSREWTAVLPVPPSVNHVWKTYRGRHVKAPAYRAWIAAAGVAARLAGKAPAWAYPVAVDVLVRGGTGLSRARDADNFGKGVCDLLASCGVIESDNLLHVTDFHVRYEHRKGVPADVVVTVREVSNG